MYTSSQACVLLKCGVITILYRKNFSVRFQCRVLGRSILFTFMSAVLQIFIDYHVRLGTSSLASCLLIGSSALKFQASGKIIGIRSNKLFIKGIQLFHLK